MKEYRVKVLKSEHSWVPSGTIGIALKRYKNGVDVEVEVKDLNSRNGSKCKVIIQCLEGEFIWIDQPPK